MKYLLFLLLCFTFCFYNSAHAQHINGVSAEEAARINGEVIIRMFEGNSPEQIVRNAPFNFELQIDKHISKHSDIWLLKFNQGNVTLDNVLAFLRNQKTLWIAQANHKIELRTAPNDALFGSQWQHDNIDSELAWDITTGGTTADGHDIVVALIESADVMGHPDLQGNHWVNTAEIPNNGIDDDNNGYVDDYNGWNVSTNNDNIGTGSHGTSCAGMIGAKGDNGIGVAGANWDVKIMDIAGHGNPFTEANIVEAYSYALDARLLWNQTNGAQGSFVVATSASWGIDGANANNFPIWCGFYDDLGQAGILNAGATTNQNQDVDTFGDVPTGCSSDYMIGVTATNNSDIIDFAGYGDQTINVAAPGSSIFTTQQNDNYGFTSGTSFACPLTAGVIGLMYSIPCPNFMSLVQSDPQGAADIVKNALENGVDQTNHLIARTISGGRINARNAIDLLMAQTCSACQPPGNISVSSIYDEEATITFGSITDATSYSIFLQQEGTNNWTSFNSSSTSFTFTNLEPCTEYEFYIQTECDNETSFSSSTFTFRTTGCGSCIDLEYCSTGTTDNPSIFVGVHEPSNVEVEFSNYIETSGWGTDIGDGYAYGNLVLVDDGSNTPEEGCNSLINGTDVDGNIAVIVRGSCAFSLKALNAQNAGATGIIIINNQGVSPNSLGNGGEGNQINIPVLMISQFAGADLLAHLQSGAQAKGFLGQQNEWIESFDLNGFTTSTGDDLGYRAPEINPIDIYADWNTTFTLTPGFDGQPLPTYTRIWVDLDQNGTFEDTDLMYDQGSASNGGALSDIFVVPASALEGSTRMRVQMAYQGYGANPLSSPCSEFTSGETEDYCVNIIKGNASVASQNVASQIRLYPNPTSSSVTFEVQAKEIERVVIYDATGKQVSQVTLKGIKTITDISSLENGIYFCHFINNNGATLNVSRLSVVK